MTYEKALEKVNKARKKRGLKNDGDLAAAMGIHVTNVYRIMKGQQFPTIKTLRALKDVLGLSSDVFIELYEGAQHGKSE